MTPRLDLKIFPMPIFAETGTTRLAGVQSTGVLPDTLSSLRSSRIAASFLPFCIRKRTDSGR